MNNNMRSDLRDGLDAMTRTGRAASRFALILIGLCGLGLVVGAVGRAIGLPEVNYLIMIGFVGGAGLLLLSPPHLLLLGMLGGSAIVVGKGGTVWVWFKAYLSFVLTILSVLVTPLLLFARAPGDQSLGTSLEFLALAMVVAMGMVASGHGLRWLQQLLFKTLPVACVVLLANMLVPQSLLAAIGVPVWLRAEDNRARLLAEIELERHRRVVEVQEECLEQARQALRMGAQVSAEGERCIREAAEDRFVLFEWYDELRQKWEDEEQAEADRLREAASRQQSLAVAHARASAEQARAEQARRDREAARLQRDQIALERQQLAAVAAAQSQQRALAVAAERQQRAQIAAAERARAEGWASQRAEFQQTISSIADQLRTERARIEEQRAEALALNGPWPYAPYALDNDVERNMPRHQRSAYREERQRYERLNTRFDRMLRDAENQYTRNSEIATRQFEVARTQFCRNRPCPG